MVVAGMVVAMVALVAMVVVMVVVAVVAMVVVMVVGEASAGGGRPTVAEKGEEHQAW